MKSIIMMLMLTVANCLSVYASAAGKITVKGHVYDQATDTQLFVVNARLVNVQDSSLNAFAIADGEFDGSRKGEYIRKSIFVFTDVDRSGKYILELTCNEYDTAYIVIDPAKVSSRLDNMDLGKIYMKRMPRQLGEVVVKASKVMFYNKGDTIVYNADAFILAEGSMLDALIRQMPGVELREDGQIYVNGRYVENLLLNGKDFFKGNRLMMLENLGAYTVKNIAVYERQDEMDRIMGNDYGIKHLSMDVRLKKEYNRGMLTNIEAGYGTSERHLGRMFGLLYSDNARLSVYGSINNLSDKRKPGQDTDFKPASMEAGDFKTCQGGIDYWAKIPYTETRFAGEIYANHQTIDDDKSVLTTTFLPGGDTYGYSYGVSRNKYLTLSSTHTLEIEKPKWNLQINPTIRYFRRNDFSSLSSATFSNKHTNMSKDIIDRIYSCCRAEMLSTILNRYIDDNKKRGNTLDVNISANSKIKMPNDVDAFMWLASGNYHRRHIDRFQRYILNFGNDPHPEVYSDRYFDNSPDYKWSVRGATGYIWAISPGMFLDSRYQFDHESVNEVSKMFRLENIYDSAEEKNDLGWLPSKSEYEATLDPDNSFNSVKDNNIHSLNFNWSWMIDYKFYICAKLPMVYKSRSIRYTRGGINTSFSIDKLLVGDASLSVNYWGNPHFVYFDYQRTVSSPDMIDMVDFTDNLDPLKVRSGNPELKDSELHDFKLSYRKDSRLYQAYSLHGTFLRNALAYGYGYDTSKGIKTGKMYNVNGNYITGVSQYLSVWMGPSKRFNISNKTTLDYRRNADLIGENTAAPVKNIVDNILFSEGVDFTYKFDKSEIAILGKAELSRFCGRQSNFSSFTAKDFKYGIKGNFELPCGFGISTDFMVYTRRGYSDALLDKTNYVWNAQARYSLLKGRLIFMVDGFDILHNLGNVFYTVNAQARTETCTNVQPRYVMLHIQWKFHMMPRKSPDR